MSEVQPFSHPFFDIEIEPTIGDEQAYFVKVLSVSGHRFTYELHGPLDQPAIDYMKSLLDVACFGDLVIEPVRRRPRSARILHPAEETQLNAVFPLLR